MLQESLRVQLAEELISGEVKGRDDLLWVTHELGVEVRVEPMEVVTVDVQEWLLQQIDL